MKTQTKVLIGSGIVGAAFAICCKWGPCCACFKNNGDVYQVPQGPQAPPWIPPDPAAGMPPPALTPINGVTAAGPMTPSPTDFSAARTNISNIASFDSDPGYILE